MFVLEMGEPVKIIDLAETMIRLSGLEPGRDIAIEVVGARPGEKFHEDLFNLYEHPQPTPAQKILRARAGVARSGVGRGDVQPKINLLVLEGDAAVLAEHVVEPRVGPTDVQSFRRPDRHVDCARSMGSIPFAFSVHHFINSVGADAGFAAIIGLAILMLLYFAQARETSSLREQAYESAQRVQQLENRLAQLSRMPAPAPVHAQPGVPAHQAGAPAHEPVPSRTGAPAAAPAAAGAAAAVVTARATPEIGAPAGVGAPALTAATKLIPAGAVVAGAQAFQGEEPDLTTVGSPAPATVAGGANGHATIPPPIAAPAPGQQGSTDAGTMAPPPRVQIRPSATALPTGRRPAPRQP